MLSEFILQYKLNVRDCLRTVKILAYNEPLACECLYEMVGRGEGMNKTIIERCVKNTEDAKITGFNHHYMGTRAASLEEE